MLTSLIINYNYRIRKNAYSCTTGAPSKLVDKESLDEQHFLSSDVHGEQEYQSLILEYQQFPKKLPNFPHDRSEYIIMAYS